jgi:cysteinyl-tRNA synthetase
LERRSACCIFSGKSLKNFTSIRALLNLYSARQIRLLFLMAPWSENINFSENSLTAAKAKENEINEFFLNTQVVVRNKLNLEQSEQLWLPSDREFYSAVSGFKQSCHELLCDNFSYHIIMHKLSAFLSETAKYRALSTAQLLPLQESLKFVDKLLRIFGLISDPEPGFSSQSSKGIDKILDALCSFRDSIREAARAKTDYREILNLCDNFRNNSMIEAGVRIEDLAGGSVWKLDDPAKLIKEREAKKQEELANQQQKLRNKLEKLNKDLVKALDSSIDSKTFFAAQVAQYKRFDGTGKPTHDSNDQELSKSALKAMTKQWDQRDKFYQEHLQKLAKDPEYINKMKAEKESLEQSLAGLH